MNDTSSWFTPAQLAGARDFFSVYDAHYGAHDNPDDLEFTSVVTPLLVESFGAEPARLIAALGAMQVFIHRRTKEALRQSEERFQLMIDSVEDYAILLLDPGGRVASWNAGAERIHGYTAAQIVGQHYSRFYPIEEQQRDRPSWQLRMAAAQGRIEDDGWRVRLDGTRFWANTIITALNNQEGALVGFVKVTRDFTRRRAAEQELANVNRFLDSVIEYLPAMLVVKDAKTLRYMRFNKAGEELTGIKREDLLGRTVYDLTDDATADGVTALDMAVFDSGGTPRVDEQQTTTPDGTRHLLTRRFPIVDDVGNPLHILSISIDVTEAKQAREEVARANTALQRANAELVSANRAKSDFLAMMSHELRTPLNSVIGFSEVLTDQKFGALNERQTRYVRNIHDSGRHLLSLINDLLDLSKIEAGRIDLLPLPCSARLVAAESVAMLQPQADERRIEVVVDAGGAAPIGAIVADVARLKQVLYNLLSNAIKFTPVGGRVECVCTPSPRPGFVRIAVIDTGAGISAPDLERLFTAFTQLGNARNVGGTGLGLALAKRLVELMDGHIGVESAPGVGSRFFIDLPLADREPVAPRPSKDGRSDAPLALVVDDDPGACELLVITLQGAGYRTLVARNSDEALALARQHKPDVVTLDVFLPILDGWDVLRILRGDAETASIPVVMITISSDRRKALHLGAYEHLIKPVEREQLIEALERRNFTVTRRDRIVRLLAIDGDPAHLLVARATLEPHGFEVRTASDGRAGVALALREPVDLILLDPVLPDLSGIEVVEALRADERTRATPILVVTGDDLSPTMRERLARDVEAVLPKAILRPTELIAEIDRVLRRRP